MDEQINDLLSNLNRMCLEWVYKPTLRWVVLCWRGKKKENYNFLKSSHLKSGNISLNHGLWQCATYKENKIHSLSGTHQSESVLHISPPWVEAVHSKAEEAAPPSQSALCQQDM